MVVELAVSMWRGLLLGWHWGRLSCAKNYTKWMHTKICFKGIRKQDMGTRKAKSWGGDHKEAVCRKLFQGHLLILGGVPLPGDVATCGIWALFWGWSGQNGSLRELNHTAIYSKRHWWQAAWGRKSKGQKKKSFSESFPVVLLRWAPVNTQG